MAQIFEALSNEILVEIFEYLDAYHLFKAFLTLNIRFHRLLHDPRLSLKLNSKYTPDKVIGRTHPWSPMVHQLTAVTLINDKHVRTFMAVCKESDLTALRALHLRRVRLRRDRSAVVKYISNLQRLQHLHVHSRGEIVELTFLVLCSGTLCELKSYECTNPDEETNVMFPSNTKTNIERLTVDCVTYGLGNLLLQTPRLQYLHLHLTDLGPKDFLLTSSPLPILTQLVHLKLHMDSVSYVHLTELLAAMPNLESLELTGLSTGPHFDDGRRLKQLFERLQVVILQDVRCSTAARATTTILGTFDDYWSDVTCTIDDDLAYISACGQKV